MRQEWTEWTGYAFHIRRRLTPDEQSAIGPAVDLRGSQEAIERFNAVKAVIPAAAVGVAMQELHP